MGEERRENKYLGCLHTKISIFVVGFMSNLILYEIPGFERKKVLE